MLICQARLRMFEYYALLDYGQDRIYHPVQYHAGRHIIEYEPKHYRHDNKHHLLLLFLLFGNRTAHDLSRDLLLDHHEDDHEKRQNIYAITN